jgi:ribosomal protein S21
MKDTNNKKSKKQSNKNAKGGEYTTTFNQDSRYDHIEPVQAQPLEVKVYGNNFDKALRAFRAVVQKERILSIYKEKQSYEKPSQRRRRKRNEMKRKLLELDNKTFFKKKSAE